MPANVLVIDSSNAIKKVIEIALKSLPVQLTSTSSVEEAASQTSGTTFIAVIMDASFISAYQASMTSFDSTSTPALIVLRGSNGELSEADLRVKGADHVLNKPFDPQSLKQLIQSFIPAPSTAAAAGSDEDILDEIHKITEGELENVKTTPTKTDTARKGKKAFLDEITESVTDKITKEVDHQVESHQPTISRPSSQPASDRAGAAIAGETAEELQKLLANQLPHMIQKEVSKYCEEHFDELARSVVETELRRLAMERARHLVDN